MKKFKNFNVNIYGEKWLVKFADEIPQYYIYPAIGLCDPRDKTIWIKNGMDRKNTEITFLHELFHAYVRRSGISNGNISEEMEEIIADQFATILSENFDFEL